MEIRLCRVLEYLPQYQRGPRNLFLAQRLDWKIERVFMSAKFQISILLYEKENRLLLPEAEIPLHFEDVGITASFAKKSLQELGMNAQRVAKIYLTGKIVSLA